MAKKKAVSKTRRANNEGSVFQRSDGRWGGALTLGYDENGKIIRKTIYGKTQVEVVKKLSEISGRLKSNTYELVENNNLETLMFEYLMTFKKSAVSPRTFEGNIRNFKLHIAPQIGKMKVYEIDSYAIQKLVNTLIDQGYSNDTIKKCKHLLNQFFEYSIDNKWILVNPTLKVKVKGKRNIYEEETPEKYKALPPEIRDRFLAEGIACFLSKQYEGKRVKLSCISDDLLDKTKANNISYNNYYILTRYLIENYDKKFVFELFQNRSKTREFLQNELYDKVSKSCFGLIIILKK